MPNQTIRAGRAGSKVSFQSYRRRLRTTTSKGMFQFLAGVSFVFVVWNPIFCMVFPVHIVLNIGGFQAWSHKKIEVSGHIF